MMYVHIQLEDNIDTYTVAKTQVKIEAGTGKMYVTPSPRHMKES